MLTSSEIALEFDVESWSICDSPIFLDFKNSETFDLSMLENCSEYFWINIFEIDLQS
jgi:hypothetical protein